MKKNKLYLLGKVFIWLMLVLMYMPIVILVIFSFSGSSGIGAWGNFDFTFDLYAGLFTNEQIMSAVANTFIIAGVSCLFATFFGTISAVGI